MITKKELEEYARLKGLNLGNAEKDYLIDMALLSISRHTKNELVFKGGTCLYKFHKLNRFSEDLDFSGVAIIDADRLLDRAVLDFGRFGISASCKTKHTRTSALAALMVEGPLFSGSAWSRARIEIDINWKSPVFLEPEMLSSASIYPELPSIRVLCMRQEEIFAEKIRAIVTRQRARDLFDLNYFLQRGIYSDKALIEKKLMYYNLVFDIRKVLGSIRSLAACWKKELYGITPAMPEFAEVSGYVAKRIKELYGK